MTSFSMETRDFQSVSNGVFPLYTLPIKVVCQASRLALSSWTARQQRGKERGRADRVTIPLGQAPLTWRALAQRPHRRVGFFVSHRGVSENWLQCPWRLFYFSSSRTTHKSASGATYPRSRGLPVSWVHTIKSFSPPDPSDGPVKVATARRSW